MFPLAYQVWNNLHSDMVSTKLVGSVIHSESVTQLPELVISSRFLISYVASPLMYARDLS